MTPTFSRENSKIFMGKRRANMLKRKGRIVSYYSYWNS